MHVRQRRVHRRVVLLHHRFAALAIRIRNCLLDRGNRLFPWKHTADRKKARLHDRVDPAAHPGRPCHGVAVNHEEPQFLLDNGFLRLPRDVVPDFVGSEWRVQQEDRARLRCRQHVNTVHELELVARHEIRLRDQVR